MKKVSMMVIVALLFIAACAGQNVKQFSDMSPKEKGTFFMKMYNGQFDNYQKQSTMSNLTDEQKDILRAKYDTLKKMWPIVNAYNMVINAGSVPSIETEQQLLDFIDQLSLQVI